MLPTHHVYLYMFNNICSITCMKANLLLVKLGSLNHAAVWNLTSGGLLTPWSAQTVMSSVLFNVGPNPPLPPPCPHSVHSSCDKRRPSLTTVLSVSVYYYEHKKSKNEGRLGSNGAMISRGCLMKSSSVFPLVPFRLVVLSFPSCSLVRLLSLSWSSSLWWLNQEVCWEYTRGGEMTTAQNDTVPLILPSACSESCIHT